MYFGNAKVTNRKTGLKPGAHVSKARLILHKKRLEIRVAIFSGEKAGRETENGKISYLIYKLLVSYLCNCRCASRME